MQSTDAYSKLRDHMQSCGIPEDQWSNVANCTTSWLTDVTKDYSNKSDFDALISEIRSQMPPSSFNEASSSLGQSTKAPQTSTAGSSPPSSRT